MNTPATVRRNTPQRYRMEAGKCASCGKVYFPPRVVCACGSRKFKAYSLPSEGKVVAHTVIRTAPRGFGDEAPYCMGIVELKDGTRILCQIADCEPERLKVGLPVALEFRKIQEAGESGVIAYGYKAVPER
ncbi:MAG: Zn-ribbon domain-containing OB-fold protein [Acidobacteriota bacterium]